MTTVSSVISVIRGEISKLKIPSAHEKVYNDECVLSFDSPFSDNGLFVNMSTFLGYGADYYLDDSVKTKCRLYLHEKWTQIPIAVADDSGRMETDTKVSLKFDLMSLSN
jgi:Variant UBP zinc finger